ncbi:hypothetical protein ACIBHX_04495 [Nonomuraea sp. NPDC050536]|uniref:hypothetical protein n=1 Tax=Nonomuraea sp. NPDC050536 TaxID=3364366 RepID=UPI0037CBDE4E
MDPIVLATVGADTEAHSHFASMDGMSGIIYVRDVEDDVIETLKQRAAEARMSLSAYAAQQLTLVARRPTNADVVRRARQYAAARRQSGALTPTTDEVVEAVRAERDRDTLGDSE